MFANAPSFATWEVFAKFRFMARGGFDDKVSLCTDILLKLFSEWPPRSRLLLAQTASPFLSFDTAAAVKDTAN